MLTARAVAVQKFPAYTPAEKVADATVHGLGLLGASGGTVYLFSRIVPAATGARLAALVIYAVALLGMLLASASYNLMPPGRLKSVLRQVDHAMIFVMIAASYMPFAIMALRPSLGLPVCAAVWILAVVGVVLRIASNRLYTRISMGLYLGMGWLVLAVSPPLVTAVSGSVVALLFAGGIVYSLGSYVHARLRMRFHNAAWHALVVIAAFLHLAAIAQLTPQ